MNVLQRRFWLLLLLTLLCSGFCHAQFVPEEWVIPAKGNCYITRHPAGATCSAPARKESRTDFSVSRITPSGVVLKNDSVTIASFFVYIPYASTPRLSFNALGNAQIRVTAGSKSYQARVASSKLERVEVGELNVSSPGYLRVDVSLTGAVRPSYAAISDLVLSGLKEKPIFVRKKYDAYYGRRGALVNLFFDTQACDDAEWAYAEARVPRGCDHPGSNFCVLNFDGGFLSLQNHPVRGRFLSFTVTGVLDPDRADDDVVEQPVKVISRGISSLAPMKDRSASRMAMLTFPYTWKADSLYRFLLHAVHPDAITTDYTAYFYQPSTHTWQSLGTVRRHSTEYLLTSLGAFVENADPETGFLRRSLEIHNVWVRGTEPDSWLHVSEAGFLCDETGRRGTRLDYSASARPNTFLLQTGGFIANGSSDERWLTQPKSDSTLLNRHLQQLQLEISNLNP